MTTPVPCPFCGSESITVSPIRDGYRANCRECGSSGSPEFHGPSSMPSADVRAAEAWDRRVTLSASLPADVAGVVTTLERHAVINEEMGRVVTGQVSAMRRAAALISALSADNARLMAALERIAATREYYDGTGLLQFAPALSADTMQEIAFNALAARSVAKEAGQ